MFKRIVVSAINQSKNSGCNDMDVIVNSYPVYVMSLRPW